MMRTNDFWVASQILMSDRAEREIRPVGVVFLFHQCGTSLCNLVLALLDLSLQLVE